MLLYIASKNQDDDAAGAPVPNQERRRVYFNVLLIVGRQKGSPRNILPRARPVSEYKITVEHFAPVRWTACYVAREDTVEGPPALLIFTSIERAATYAAINLEGQDVAIVEASEEEIQKHAFGGDPN